MVVPAAPRNAALQFHHPKATVATMIDASAVIDIRSMPLSAAQAR